MPTAKDDTGSLAPVEGARDAAMPSEATIFTLVCAYLPGYRAGGPIRSIENLVTVLGSEFHFRIVTLDRDLGDKLPFPGIVVNRWVRVGHADVMYTRPGLRGVLGMCALFRSVDRNTILYLNSFLNRRFSMLAMLMCWLKLCGPRCVVIAPRGEFSPGAMKLKRRRKLLCIRISRWLGLHRGLIWHASSEFEAVDIRRHFPLARHVDVASILPAENVKSGRSGISEVATASDVPGIAPPWSLDKCPKVPGHLGAVFVSRLSPKKNLAGALKMLQGVSGDVSFDIYGPAENAAYWEECQGLIAALPANIRVRYWGEIEHEGIGQVFAEHDLFLFPTLGENYGHVICEALSSGCPVLISDQTPWRNLEAEGVGWDIPLSETERFRSVLQQCVEGDEEWYAALSMRARNYAAKRTSDPEIIAANRRLFQRAFAWPNEPRGERAGFTTEAQSTQRRPSV
jgi:glycosyltransferase involved in cell wall biosynthesis